MVGTHATDHINRYSLLHSQSLHIEIVRNTCYRTYRESQEHMLQSIQRQLGTHTIEHIERVRNNCYRCSQHIKNVTAGHHRQRMCGAPVQMVIVHRVSKAPVQMVIAYRQWESTCRQMSNSAHRRMCHYISLSVEQSGVY